MQKNNSVLIGIILFVVSAYGPLLSQFSISNILEYQLGNLPGTDPKSLSTLYDQINISYRHDLFRLATKVETFQSADETKSYADFVQKTLSFEHENLGLTLGNFYHIIGRGLLLRSYEIPGTVLEDIGLRTRYGFYRDMEGVMASYSPSFAEIYAFYARPLNNIVPPNFSDDIRRPRLLEGVESRFFVPGWTFSGSYLRDNSEDQYDEYGSMAVEAALPYDIQIYSEYAQQLGGENEFLDLSKKTAHALYMGANWLYEAFGMSFEYKSYNEFLLGYNDPPPLVKEHQYLLLNRSTHRIIPTNETGWQSEFFYRMNEGHILNLNFAESVNELFEQRYIFQEQFFEINYRLSDFTTIKGFIDHSLETLSSIDKRYTVGAYFETEFSDLWSTSIDIEYQQFNRTVVETYKIKNYALLFSVSKAPDLSFGFVLEKSNDPADIQEDKEAEYWLGGNLAYQYSRVHLVSLFLGKRRGGNACTSGICYELLPFEGVELRITSNL